MQRYVEQLVEDLQKLAQRGLATRKVLDKSLAGDIEDDYDWDEDDELLSEDDEEIFDELAREEDEYWAWLEAGGENEYEDFKYAPMHTFLGIDPMYFPPYEKLTDEQAALLAIEIIELWLAWDIEPDIPDSYPSHLLYPMLLRKMKEHLTYYEDRFMVVDFCNLDVNNCPFTNEHCMCKDLDEDAMNDDSDELPY